MKNIQNQKTATITLPVNNEYGIVCFEDLLTELNRRHEIEADAKNEACHFILSQGHFDAYRDFNKQQQGQNINHHAACIETIAAWQRLKSRNQIGTTSGARLDPSDGRPPC